MGEYDWKYICELTDAVEKYVSMDDNEYGAACDHIAQVLRYPDYISPDLRDALIEELEQILKDYQTNYEIVREERTTTYYVERLEYIGD